MGFLFEKLDVYKKALDFAERIDNLCTELPRGTKHFSDQLRRASVSISLNVAEGNGRWHKKDRRNFFYIARGSAFECIPLLELIQRKGCLPKSALQALKEEVNIISKMLTSLIKGTEDKTNNRKWNNRTIDHN